MQDYGRRLPVDPRVVERIERSPTMMSEQGPSFMATWGGAQKYKRVAKLPVNQRRVYYAVESGIKTPEALAMELRMSEASVEKALSWLEKKGWVSMEPTPIE